MLQAIKEADKAFYLGEIPVGVVIVDNQTGTIVSKAYNKVESKSNCLYHAEIIAISKACKIKREKYLLNHDIYVTLEPCIMCLGYILQTKIKRVYYCLDNNKSQIKINNKKIHYTHSHNHKLEIYDCIMELQYYKRFKNFFLNLRKTIY